MTRHVAAGLVLLAVALVPLPVLAQLGARPADEWIGRLERPERIKELRVDHIIQHLALKPGMVVADLGAGAGVFTYPLARAVAPNGKVFAVEVDKGFITYIQKRIAEQKLSNVHTVLGKFEDPTLPEKIDLGFFHDVLHHIDKREAYLKAVASYLKPGGRIAVVELDATRPEASHRNDPHLQVSREQLQQWMGAAGLKRVQEVPLSDDKFFVIYRRE